MARMAARKIEKKVETSTTLLEAAKKVLRQNGYAGLSTRGVAAALTASTRSVPSAS